MNESRLGINTSEIAIVLGISLIIGLAGVALLRFYIKLYSGEKEGIDCVVCGGFSQAFGLISFMLLFILCLGVYYYAYAPSIFLIYGYCLFLPILAVLGLIDYKCLVVPDILLFALLGVALFMALFVSYMFGVVNNLWFGFGVGGFAFVIRLFIHSLSGKEILGDGDIIVLCALAMVFGKLEMLLIVFVGSIMALGYGLYFRISKGVELIGLKLPFVFFLALGSCIVYFCGGHFTFLVFGGYDA